MSEKNNENCGCEKNVCCCASTSAKRCRCGEDCRCERVCKCGGGCDCGCATTK